MFDFLKNKLVIFLIVVTLGILAAIVVVNQSREQANGVSSFVSTALAPVQKGITYAMGGVSDFFGNFASKRKLQEENESLSKQLGEAEGKLAELEATKAENDRLKALLDYKDATKEFSMVAAPVIATDNPGLFKSFTIQAGTRDGLLNKMPVVNEKGLIGVTNNTGAGSSKVTTLLDSSFAAGAMVVRTQDVAIVEGDLELSDQGLCKMTYIPSTASLLPGDTVVTSGLGGVFPKGLLIGKIKEIRTDVESVSKYAIIEPAVDFQHLFDVLVIKG